MKTKSLIALVVSAAVLTACQQPGQRPGAGVMNGGSVNKSDVGTVAGAIGGGVIGSTMGSGAGKTAATIGGALLGGLQRLGASLDNADRAAADNTYQRAMETSQPGQSLPWKNANTGNYGSVTPSNYYQNADGQYCREFTQKITVGGRTEQGHGTACRQPDGSWQIVN
jgi:surface antigen